MAAIHLIL